MSASRADFESVMATLGEVARYQVPGEERVLVLYPLEQGALLVDVPVSGEGECYRVDRVSQGGAVLAGLAREYVRHAHAVGASPMSRRASEVAVGLTASCLVEAFVESVWGVRQ